MRPAPRRTWDSGDLFPITSCRVLNQLWWHLRGGPVVGAQASGHVAAALGARHDIPHRAHHQRACPGVSGCRAEWPRMPGAVRAVSRSRTWRGASASFLRPGPGLGSTSPHVVSDTRPVLGEGPTGVTLGRAGRCGMGGRASGQRATRLRRTSPSSARTGRSRGWTRPSRRRPLWAGSARTACIVARATRCHIPTTPGRGRPAPCVAGSSWSRRPVASSWMNWRWGATRRAHGSDPGGGRGGPGLVST